MPLPNPQVQNLFQLAAAAPAEEVFEPLLQHPAARIERIVSCGQTTPPGEWYDQNEDEWVVLLQGQATLAYEDGTTAELGPGDYVFLPAHCKHRVMATSQQPPCIWLAVHLPPAVS
ncbi:cupin domain-containing protein [Leptolyngbya iicbica]|uniref:Cupin domain-containing protein n=2 Tax=Cyanophyceae TaxID=3028117 RepID=A0A4Q7EFR9_9CYAN|nr:cupin domain-containing protein [Leptolyngbya sp. LK]RZM81927.1 cupin domain-containing protein [Leptolyngbya sp. LK]